MREKLCAKMFVGLTTLALILDRGDGAFLPPINRCRDALYVLVHETFASDFIPMEHSVMLDLGACINASELMVGHVCKLVQLQLVRLVHLVGLVDMSNVCLEHIESLMLLVEAGRYGVVAPPPLVQIP